MPICKTSKMAGPFSLCWENGTPEFHNLVVWGKLGEACQKVLK